MTFRLASLLGCAVLANAAVTFHKDVEPILQKRCQGCHRPGEAAPMSFLSYPDARPWAKAIRNAVLQGKMPPWLADPAHGKFANDSSLSAREREVLAAWADAGAPRGDPKDAPAPLRFTEGWSIGQPDVVIEMAKGFAVPASGTVPYQYIIVPTHFTEDKWIQAAEIRPGDRSVLHHVWAFARPPDSAVWKTQPVGEFIDVEALERQRRAARKPGAPDPDMFSSGLGMDAIQSYTPNSVAVRHPEGQAKLIKAGSTIVFQLHYTASGKAATDRTRIGLIFAKQPPTLRVKTVNVQSFAFSIPAGAPNHPMWAGARLRRDITLISLRPHMHLRGKDFAYRVTYPSGETEILLRLPRWDFNWQLTYRLAEPKLLPKGTLIEIVGHFDNSANNPYNPDPKSAVTYGEQTWEEMFAALMDILVDPGTADTELFETVPPPAAPRQP